MEPYVIITVIICLTFLFLAFMGIFIKVESDWTEGSKFPKINFTFKKDTSLFEFLRPSKGKDNGKKKSKKVVSSGDPSEETVDYIEKSLFGTAIIKYGKKAETSCKCELIIKALKNDVDKYYYHNADPKAKIECISGFSNVHKGYKRLLDFDAWDSTSGDGAFYGTHRVPLSIRRMQKDEERKLAYQLLLRGNYQDVINGADRVSHGFYFRMGTETHGASLLFHIPKGKKSEIFEFRLSIQDLGKTIMKHEIGVNDNLLFSLPDEFGSGWIKMGKKNVSLNWVVPKVLKRGTICRLDWLTKRKGNS